MQIQTSNSSVRFSIKKLLVLTVKGTFPDVKGTIDINKESLSDSKIDIAISLAGLDTKNKKRNEHLQQADFFNTAKYPEITFSSVGMIEKDDSLYAVGKLSMVGESQTVKIPFQIKDNKVTGQFNLNRFDYKVGKIPAFVAAKMVDIEFDLALV